VIFRAVRPVDGPAGVVGIALATNTEVACFAGLGGWRWLWSVSGCSQNYFGSGHSARHPAFPQFVLPHHLIPIVTGSTCVETRPP
jgi:hypothetical protein